ncbi:unnamed protein product [Fusarium graminearum]|nr:unnamed protein product [Fusarium graminearum]
MAPGYSAGVWYEWRGVYFRINGVGV